MSGSWAWKQKEEMRNGSRYKVFFRGRWKFLKLRLWWLFNPMSVLKNIELCTSFYIFRGFIYLFWVGEGRGKGRQTFISCLWNAPNWGPGQQPRHGSQPESNPRPLLCGGRSTSWAMPVMDELHTLNRKVCELYPNLNGMWIVSQ